MSFTANPQSPHKVASTLGDASPKVIADLEGLSARLNSVQRKQNGSTTIIQQITSGSEGTSNIFAGAGLSFEADQQTLDVNVDNATLNIVADILAVKNKGIGPTQLADTAVTPGTYGSASAVSVITIDQQGRITSAATTSIAIAASQITSGTLAIARGGTNIGSYTTGDILYASSSTVLTKLAIGSTGNVLTVSAGIPSWAAPATSGTVTSVGLSLPSIFTVSNSPVTSTGTLTAVLATQAANTGFRGPSSGADAAPTFRTMVPLDWAASSATGGLAYSSSSTVNAWLAIGSSGQVLTVAGGVPTWASVAVGSIAGGTAGRILYDNGTIGVWNTAGSDTQTLRMNGTVPTFNSILTNDGTKITITPTSTNTGLIVTAASATTNYATAINTNGTFGLQVTNSVTPGAGSGGGMSIATTGTPSANAQTIAILAFQGVISGAYQTAADILVDSRQAWSAGNAGGSMYFRTVPQASTTPTERIRIWDDGSVSVARSGSALATSATTGQFFGPNMAGIPTGAPTRVQTGSTALVHDTSNKKLWANSGSGGTTWQGVNGFVEVTISPTAGSTTAIAATTDFEGVTTPATSTCTVTLPDAATRGPFMLAIRALTGGTVNLTIARAGSDTINGGTTSITLTVGQSICLLPVGTDWVTLFSKASTNATLP